MKYICTALGDFSVMHRGYREMIECLVAEGRERRMRTVAVGNGSTGMLTIEEQDYILMEMGVDEFRAYGLGELEKEGLTVIAARPAMEAGKVITNEWVMEELQVGNMEMVEKLCGHPYTMVGKVVHGKALGRTVGMPTANLAASKEKVLPPNGVYASTVEIDGAVYRGITNVGLRPTVDDTDLITVETFIQEFSEDIYDQVILLKLYMFIRGIKKFNGLAEVKAQVEKDLTCAKEFFENQNYDSVWGKH